MTRTELYEAVWLEPVATVAARLGISDSGLATVCKRFDIPRPPRGYWRRIKTGQRLERPALTNLDSNPEVPLTIEGAKDIGVVPAKGVAKPDATAWDKLPSPAVVQPQPDPGKPQVAEQLGTGMGRPPEHLSPELAVKRYAAVEAELERAMNAGVLYQRHQAALTVVQEVLSRAAKEDQPTSQALLAWARSLQHRLKQSDPMEVVVQAVRKSSEGVEKPLWWTY